LKWKQLVEDIQFYSSKKEVENIIWMHNNVNKIIENIQTLGRSLNKAADHVVNTFKKFAEMLKDLEKNK